MAASFSTHFELRGLPAEVQKSSRIGATVHLRAASNGVVGTIPLDVDAWLDESDRAILREGLWKYSVLVFKGQKGLDPNVLQRLAGVWDEFVKETHSAGDKVVSDKDNILSKNGGNRIPRAPMVLILGSGDFPGYEGIEDLSLKHVNQRDFHRTPLSADQMAAGETRFYRWHLDMPLHRRLPGRVTLIHGLVIPKSPWQFITFADGSRMDLAPGATAFISGATAFDNLTPEEQEWAMRTKIRYAPKAYEFIRDCRATNDGLTISSEGRERDLSELEDWTWEDSQVHPMVWKHPGIPNRPLLQIVGCCVYSLITHDPTTNTDIEITDIKQVREKIHSLMSKSVRPEFIYAHDWEEGDLVVFHNKGVWHSITGNLDDQKRLMWQCTMESAQAPEAFRE